MNAFHDTARLKPGEKTGHPERYAPNGEPLIWYPGDTWKERLAAWREQHEGEPHDAEEAHAPIESPRVTTRPQRREEEPPAAPAGGAGQRVRRPAEQSPEPEEQRSTAAQPREVEVEPPDEVHVAQQEQRRHRTTDDLPF